MAAMVGRAMPSFWKVAGRTTPLRPIFQRSSTKPSRYSPPLTTPVSTVNSSPSCEGVSSPSPTDSQPVTQAAAVHIR